MAHPILILNLVVVMWSSLSGPRCVVVVVIRIIVVPNTFLLSLSSMVAVLKQLRSSLQEGVVTRVDVEGGLGPAPAQPSSD